MSPDNPLLKDIFFSAAFLERLAADLLREYPPFDRAAFLACAQGGGFAQMALKQKMRHVTTCLRAALPDDYAQALPILLAVAPGHPTFDAMVFSDYVACYGLDDWERSLPALRELTRFMSAEFAIRPFLRQDQGRALAYLYEWAADPDANVRRLASEGSRPRLPWGMALPALQKEPAPLLPILERLKNDPSEDVRRSVANSLNDIAKDHPGLVLAIAGAWYGQNAELDRLVKHACRTLLKRGDPRAMRLFGFGEPASVKIGGLTFEPQRPAIGQDITISYVLEVETAEPCLLRLEYAVTFARPNGKRARKVFHHRENTFAPGRHTIAKKHSFRDLSTRRHYPGEHVIEIIVNGETRARGSVLLLSG